MLDNCMSADTQTQVFIYEWKAFCVLNYLPSSKILNMQFDQF